MIDTKKNDSICAIIVTYDRKKLLLECIESVLMQATPVDAIYVIDNASTDGTPELLKEKEYIRDILSTTTIPLESENMVKTGLSTNLDRSVRIHYVRMHKNTGGAGGFCEGVKRAYGKSYDLLWLLDDDTMCRSDTLKELYKAFSVIEEKNAGFVVSNALWTDGFEHRMNIPSFRLNYPGYSKYFDHGILPIKSAAFVSMLIKKEVVEKIGYPAKEYFIWSDDTEYCYRMLKSYLGFFVNKSVVVHKTIINYMPMETAGDKFFYEARNKIWLLKKKEIGWDVKLRLNYELLRNIGIFLSKGFSFKKLRITAKGIIKGVFSNPK